MTYKLKGLKKVLNLWFHATKRVPSILLKIKKNFTMLGQVSSRRVTSISGLVKNVKQFWVSQGELPAAVKLGG